MLWSNYEVIVNWFSTTGTRGTLQKKPRGMGWRFIF
jgi:hypothetical protein